MKARMRRNLGIAVTILSQKMGLSRRSMRKLRRVPAKKQPLITLREKVHPLEGAVACLVTQVVVEKIRSNGQMSTMRINPLPDDDEACLDLLLRMLLQIYCLLRSLRPGGEVYLALRPPPPPMVLHMNPTTHRNAQNRQLPPVLLRVLGETCLAVPLLPSMKRLGACHLDPTKVVLVFNPVPVSRAIALVILLPLLQKCPREIIGIEAWTVPRVCKVH